MLEPNENARLLSDLLKKVDEKKPEKETLAQVNSSFCLNKNKNKIAEFTQSLSAMRTKLSGLAKGTFVAPLLRMTCIGNILRKSCHSEGNSPKNLCLEKGDPSLTLRMTGVGEVSPKTKLAPQCPRALASLKRRSFTSFGMTDVGEVAHTAQPKSVEKAVLAKPKKVAAFTLAEVLVTLGIIGIVAAMTLPSLITTYKKLVFSALLKQDVSYIENSIKELLSEEGVDNLCQSSYIKPWDDTAPETKSYLVDVDRILDALKLESGYSKLTIKNFDEASDRFNNGNLTDKELGIVQNKYVLKAFDIELSSKAKQLKNGSCIALKKLSAIRGGALCTCGNNAILYRNRTHEDCMYFLFAVDLNCDNPPNEAGVDVHYFYMNKYGVTDNYEMAQMDDSELEEDCNEYKKGLNVNNSDFGREGTLWHGHKGAYYCSELVRRNGYNIK